MWNKENEVGLARPEGALETVAVVPQGRGAHTEACRAPARERDPELARSGCGRAASSTGPGVSSTSDPVPY